MTTGMGAKFTFVKTAGGYIRDTGMCLKGPPIIVASHRMVQEGKMDEYITN